MPQDADWIPSGAKAKAKANLDAIRLLKQLEAENRNPTPDEKAVLAQYTGWGGIKQVFDVGKAAYREREARGGYIYEDQRKEWQSWEKQWGKTYDEVKNVLTPEEWDAARASILNAHYTSRTAIKGLWQMVERLGFKGGNVLETSAGIGHFIGLEPEALRQASRWNAVELDNVSGRILSKLYPQARVQVKGFQDARLPNNSQDLIVGNVPFAKDGPTDKRYPSFSLHNYFFARGLDLLRPGGLMVAITSDSTMDNDASRKAREFYAERADLVGAVRLPNNAFKENAGTEVTTDILIFRKRDGTPYRGNDFLRTVAFPSRKGAPVEINEYFAAHPEMMLGTMSREGTMYGPDQQALMPHKDADLGQQLAEAAAKLPADAFGAQATPEAAQAREVAAESGDKVGALVFREGKPYVVNADGTLTAPDWAGNAKAVKQAARYANVRSTTRNLVLLQLDPDATEAAIAEQRAQLNRQYDAYVKEHGPFNKRASAWLDEDVDFPMVLALEDDVSRLVEAEVKQGKRKGQKVARREVEYVKSKLFSERTIFPRMAPTSAASVEDGYQVSVNYRGRVDVDYISQLTGQTPEAVRAALVNRKLAFENPTSGQMEPRWQYLSGTVKQKLRAAEAAAADNPQYAVNVEALKAVQPPAIPMENISVRLGATWVPPSVIARFLQEKLEVKADVNFTPQTGNWSVSPTAGWTTALNTTTYGIHGISGSSLVAMALNLKSPIVTETERRVSPETGKAYDAEVKNPAKSLEAQEKQNRIKQLFVDWVRQTPMVARELEGLYNEQFNGVVAPQYEAPTWTHYPNATQDIQLREMQKRGVTRMLQNSTLLAHAVGTGKTFAMITTAMEQRRLGLAKKPMIVVQNATLEQFARAFKRLYPTARILAPGAKQRDAKNRNKTMSRIATGDWDAVIVPQSFVNLLPDDPKRESDYIRDQIKEMEEARLEAEAQDGKKSPKAADLQKAIDRLKQRLTDLAARKTDDVLTFEQLGVDSLFVDEAHAYKKLQFSTKMDNIKGLDVGASQRGFSMMMKVRWVQEHNQGRNVVFATGTPVSNTIAEAWNMMRYVRPDVLEDYGIAKFDDFAGTFGDTVTQLEMTAGGTWKPVTRFARYTNGPELIAAWRTVADVVTAEEMQLPGLPALDTGKTIPVIIKQSPELEAYVKVLRAELEAFDAMKGREKRENSHIPLVVFGKARKATLDMRMINPNLPDQPGSKANVAADNIFKVWQDSAPVQGAQMVFSDAYQDNPDNPQFNLYQEMKRKLIERGIPENEIAIITADIKDAKREALFQKVNDGEVRVVLGSTERMGVGVNAQRKLIALHHLDAPMRPMDVEQRNGRIVRQGNENPVVQVFSYGVENTLDAALFQKLATKQRFINQILRGDLQGRNFEDAADEVSLSFEEQMAAFSGDPLALERVTLDNQVRQLESLRNGHIEQVRKGREELEYLTLKAIPRLTQELADARAVAEKFSRAFAGEVEIDFTHGQAAKGREDVIKLLDQKFKRILDTANEKAASLAATSNSGLVKGGTEVALLNGQRIAFEATAWVGTKWAAGEDGKQVAQNYAEPARVVWQFENVGAPHNVGTGQGVLQGLPAELLNITQHLPEQAAKNLASSQRNQTQLAGFVLQPFEREAELEKARRRLAEVDAKLEAKGKPAVPPAGQSLFDYPKSPKPLAAQREHIRRLLTEMEQQYAASGERERVERARIQTEFGRKPNPGELAGYMESWNQGRFDGLMARLAEVERLMLTSLQEAAKQITDNTEDGKELAEDADATVRDALTDVSANPLLNPRFWKAIAISGWRTLRDLGQFTATKAQWAAAMVRKFGDRVRQYLDATWTRLARLQHQQANGVSAVGQGHLNQIEEASGHTNIAEEQKPLYDAETLAQGKPSLLTRAAPTSTQIRILGGDVLAEARRLRDVTEATQSAAVKKQSDNLWKQLVAGAREANPLSRWKLPDWITATPRARAFKQRVLHIAARLNATGRDPQGNFTFGDFAMRAGSMSLSTASKSQLTVGDQFQTTDPITGVTETLTLGPVVTTPEGRVFHQLLRAVDTATQTELYQHFAREYPELIWFLDMFIDPALAGMRQRINGIEVPVFNRFAAAAMMADADPNFSALTAYTPDVLVTRSLLGSIRGALSFRSGTRSAGRKYKSGTSREGGHVRDLLSGFNVRTWQMLAEKSRREWRTAVLNAATPIKGGRLPNDGWERLETGRQRLFDAVKELRNWQSPIDPTTGNPLFPETQKRMSDDSTPEWKAFFGEAARLKGAELMLPKALTDQLIRRYVAQVEHGKLFRLGEWAVRNSTRSYLAMSGTYVANVLTNDLFTLQASARAILSGLGRIAFREGNSDVQFRLARELLSGEFWKWFPGLRGMLDGTFRNTLREVLPDNIFADQTALADVKVRMDEDPMSYLREGEIGAAALQVIRYGDIDVKSKQRMAYAWLKAQAVTNARRAGLRGPALRQAVEAYMANPPMADRARAVDIAGFELLNYADTPEWMEKFANGKWRILGADIDVGDYSKLLVPFPRFGYHYLVKSAREIGALKDVLARVPKRSRADALADVLTFLLFPAGGLGVVLAKALGGDDDEDARRRVGASFTKEMDRDGNVVQKPLPRDLMTVNRMNLSAWARGLGLGTEREDDFWLRVRNYPVLAMAGAAILAENDARKFGPKEGAKSYASAVGDLASDFFSLGAAARVPAKLWQEFFGRPGDRMAFDPYGSGVPLVAYVTDQTLDSLVPGSRQADLLIRWLDPVQRQRNATKDFTPGAWDAARVGHVTGLLDRMFTGQAGRYGPAESTLPAEMRRGQTSPQVAGEFQRALELAGFNVRPVPRRAYERAVGK